MTNPPQEKADAFGENKADFHIDGVAMKAPGLAPGLYIVSTPIGHLADITLRALHVLAGADLIACEDTRTSRVLLERYGIRTRRSAYHEHNAETARPKLLSLLKEGGRVAQISDAGTPLVSDPGFRLVRDALDAGIVVHPIPGASAPLAGLVASGLPSDTVLFGGFLPQKDGARRGRLEELASIPATLILFESPARLAKSLASMADVLGGARQAAVARELTKKFEEVRRGSLGELAAHYQETGAPKGEIVVLIEPPGAVTHAAEDVDALLLEAVGRLGATRGAAEVAALLGLKKRDLYNRALELRQEEARRGEGS